MKRFLKAVLKRLFKFGAKRSVKIRNLVRYIGNSRLEKRFKRLSEENDQDEKTVVFMSFMGRGFSDSPLALYRQMLQDPYFDDWTFIWAFKKKKTIAHKGRSRLAKRLLAKEGVTTSVIRELEQYSRAKTVAYNSPKFYRTLAMSKYWVTNSRVQEGLWPEKNHVYVQSWHGTPLKRLGADLDYSSNALYNTKQIAKQYTEEGEKMTYLLSPSEYYTEKMKSAFAIDSKSKVKIIQEGYPRNDFLVNHTGEDVKRIKKQLDIDPEKKVLLYAPTWRDDQYDLRKGYTYKTGADFDLLKEQLGDEWVILFRAHYFIASRFDFSEYEGFIYNVSKYSDINELYIASDILITDYSSVFFDYSVLQRPIIFFMYDKEQYASELRGFYLDLDELPGDIVETTEGVVEVLHDISTYEKRYAQDLKKFRNKFSSKDDGSSSKRVVEHIFKNS